MFCPTFYRFQQFISERWRTTRVINNNNSVPPHTLLHKLDAPMALLYEVPEDKSKDKLLIPIETKEFLIGNHLDCDLIIPELTKQQFKLSYMLATSNESAHWKVTASHRGPVLVVNLLLRSESKLVARWENSIGYKVAIFEIRASPELPWRVFHFIADFADYYKKTAIKAAFLPKSRQSVYEENKVLERKLKLALDTFRSFKVATLDGHEDEKLWEVEHI